VQAKDLHTRPFWRQFACSATLLILGILVSACGGRGGMDLERLAADRSLITGSISKPSAPKPADHDVSDALTIRNAVSSVDVEQLGGSELGWANPETGSRGRITDLAEYRDDIFLCRRFTTTRESFEGVALYQGEACLGPSGAWTMRSFEAI